MSFKPQKPNRERRGPGRALRQLALIAAAIALASPMTVDASEPAQKAAAKHSQLLDTTANFTVRSFRGGPNAAELATRCESLRMQIHEKWLQGESQKPWQPRCLVVVHASKASYIRAVGRGAGQTSGTSLIQQQNKRIVYRRIDLLLDKEGRATALPHELTHVVLADAFVGRQPPPWLDEGIATLADSDRKLALHQRDCDNAVRHGTAFLLIDLLTLERLSSSQFPAFYGQSVSLVKLLCDRDDPAKLVPFAKVAMDKGYDEALRTQYQIDGVGRLQRIWLDHMSSENRGQNFHLASARVEK